MPLNDVVVTIDIAYPAPRIGLGRPLILSTKTGTATYKEYYTLEGVLLDYAATTNEYKKAKAVFDQPNRPDLIAIGTYAADPADTLNQFFKRPWHFALVANDLSADQVKVANFFATKTFKFGAYQVATTAARTALKGKKRAIILDHNVEGEHFDAAVIGNLASLTVGSITWKFKDVVGITPRYLSENEMTLIDADNAIAYVVKTNKGQLSDGKLANGEWIDVIHGQDWIKADMENEVQYTMQNSGKLPYDERGINSLVAAATTTLQRGYENGIIAKTADGEADYTITAIPREETDPQDRNDRIYRGLSFELAPAGAIHDARIKGSMII